MSASGTPVSARMFSKNAMLSRIMAIFSGSANCARNAASEAEVVSSPNASRFSRMVAFSPAQEQKNALAAPTMPPPIMRMSGVCMSSGIKPEGSPTQFVGRDPFGFNTQPDQNTHLSIRHDALPTHGQPNRARREPAGMVAHCEKKNLRSVLHGRV